jgi:hypothetical protein
MIQIRRKRRNILWRNVKKNVKKNVKLIVTVINAGNRGQIYKRL